MARNPDPQPLGDDAIVEPPPPARNPWREVEARMPPRRAAGIAEVLAISPRRPAPMRWPRWRKPLAVALLALWLGGTSLHLISHSQRALVSTLGRTTRELGPGLALTAPWPIESVAARDLSAIERLGPGETPAPLLLTRDGELIALGWELRWRVSDLRRFATASAQPERWLTAQAEEAVRAAVAEERFAPLWQGERQAALAQRVRTRLQARFDAGHSGIEVVSLAITRADPPAQLAEGYEAVGRARDKARADLTRAQDWARNRETLARSEAEAFDKVYAQYQAAPDVTRSRMYYETMERVIAGTDRVVVGASSAAPQPAARGDDTGEAKP